MISKTLGSFLKLTDPIVNYWMARIYTSIPLDSLLFCAVECEFDLDCKLFTIEDGLCHLGNGITYNHSVLPIENHSEEIYVDTGTFIKCSCFQRRKKFFLFSGIINELGPMYLLNNSNASWVKYIYYENQCDSRDRCELWCYLESTPCQFIVYTELVCHLGTTGKENDSLVSLQTTTQQDIWLNKSKFLLLLLYYEICSYLYFLQRGLNIPTMRICLIKIYPVPNMRHLCLDLSVLKISTKAANSFAPLKPILFAIFITWMMEPAFWEIWKIHYLGSQALPPLKIFKRFCVSYILFCTKTGWIWSLSKISKRQFEMKTILV